MINAPRNAGRSQLSGFFGAPLEADPMDWADQQRPQPVPDDDYPHAADRHRLTA